MTSGCRSRRRVTPRTVRDAGSRPTPRPATIISCTRSRLSARCVTRGSKPASEAMTRTTSSSAVLRELTIQSWSRYWRNTSATLPRGRSPEDGVPRLHATELLAVRAFTEPGRREVVVIGEHQVDLVGGQQGQGLVRLVLEQLQPDL